METKKVIITGIIDAAANKVLGLGAEVKANVNSKGKARNLNTVLFFLATPSTREMKGERKPQARLSLADQLRMKGYMAAKGTESVDYSTRNTTTVFEVPKNIFAELVGTSYEDTNLESLLNVDANEEFAAFKENPHFVWNEEITADEYDNLSEGDKLSYQPKRAGSNGLPLTHNGQQIYRKTSLAEVAWGVEDVFLAHEQSSEEIKAGNAVTSTGDVVKA